MPSARAKVLEHLYSQPSNPLSFTQVTATSTSCWARHAKAS